MTYAMWGILTAMMLILSVSFHRYRKSVARKQETRWLNEHHVIDRLRAIDSVCSHASRMHSNPG
ncbi:hypothetical protein LMG29542_06911 [Paraburkholderia humisilvae]|uniref:Uncharacterized protein n=1 Tax=Paraburkholderia humisilvae TaxID=627669 RepID=A0A6J5F2I2_9BURK|nr:hypothetical protein LMG29542_06911 [Paraburkholderia humisilvae]